MTLLPLPIAGPLWALARLEITRTELRAMLGEPHYIETDNRRTCGGEEDCWGYALTSGQRVLIVLDPITGAVLYGDPPNLGPILEALHIPADDPRLRHGPQPIPVI